GRPARARARPGRRRTDHRAAARPAAGREARRSLAARHPSGQSALAAARAQAARGRERRRCRAGLAGAGGRTRRRTRGGRGVMGDARITIELNPRERRLYDRLRQRLVPERLGGATGARDLLLFLPDLTVLLARLLRDGRVPLVEKAIAVGGIA